MSLGQLKVMSAIERCRTAALGGHVMRCENDACGHTAIAYNSDLCIAALSLSITIASTASLVRPIMAGRMGTIMLETYFSAAKMLGHLRSGPSGPYLDGFAEVLERQGYGPETAVRYLRAAAHIGHVMIQCAGLTDIDLAAFDEHLRTCRCPRAKGGQRNHHTVYGARLFRRHLVELGICRSAAVVAAPAEPKLVADFKDVAAQASRRIRC